MDVSERRTRIRANLGIEPITHGQVYTFQIAIPESEQQSFSLERRQLIEDSLTQHKTNLVPLMVRRTEAYTDEEEYEVVYGADWCLVAKELEIEKLWVWVYDLTDEQAVAAKEEMQQLVGFSNLAEKSGDEETDIGDLVEQKLKPIYTKLNQLIFNSSDKAEKPASDEKLKVVESKVDRLLSSVEILAARLELLTPEPKLNLLQAKEEEIDNVLEEAGASTIQRKAALEAIRYWQKLGKVLTWRNLQNSTKSGEHKIKNFGEGAYKKLKEVADIRV